MANFILELAVDFNDLTIQFESDAGTAGYGYYAILSWQKVTVTDADGKELALSPDNTYAFFNSAETVNVSGEKTWLDNDNQDGLRPAVITVNLYKQVGDKQPERIESKPVRSDNEGKWRWKFTDLPKYEDGIEIVYTITEDEVEGYETEVNGYNVANRYTPDKPPAPHAPETGDDSSPALWIGMLLLSTAVLPALKRRERGDRK